MSKLEAIKEKIKRYDYIRFTMCDVNGMYRGQVLASRHAHRFLETGVEMYEAGLLFGPRSEMFLIEHDKAYNAGSMALVPDLDTFRPIPWAVRGAKVAELLCETRWKVDMTPQAACPRYVAKQQLKRLSDLGYDWYSGYEVEFRVYEKESERPIFDGCDAFSQRAFNRCSDIMFEFDENFCKSGIDVERYHCEYDGGMMEAITAPKYGIEACDMVLNLRESLLEIADLKGLFVSFMSKQTYDKNCTGVGLHSNFSVWDKSGKNVFFDKDSSDNLSVFAKHWIAGILKHSKALCAFANPTVNCYRRLHQLFFPSSISWGIQDRFACLRVKNHGEDQTYLENRVPGGKSNPYLLTAATIAAGLDGVEKKMECPPPGQTEKDEYLPRSLEEAVKELEADTDLVDALGKELVAWFVKCKKEGEIVKYVGVETDEKKFVIEREKYFY